MNKLFYHFTATYSEARENLKRAEETSDLDSDRDKTEKRRRKKKEILLPGEQESSDDETHHKKRSFPTNNRSHSHPYPSLDSFSCSTRLGQSSSSSSSSLLLQPLQDVTDQLNTIHRSPHSKSSPAHQVMLPPSPPSCSVSSPGHDVMSPYSPSSRSTSSPVIFPYSPSSHITPSPVHNVTMSPSHGSGLSWMNSSAPHHGSMGIRGSSITLGNFFYIASPM